VGEQLTLLRSLVSRGLAIEPEHETFEMTEAGWQVHGGGAEVPAIVSADSAQAHPGQYPAPSGAVAIERGSF
jgi:hypothetical protein